MSNVHKRVFEIANDAVDFADVGFTGVHHYTSQRGASSGITYQKTALMADLFHPSFEHRKNLRLMPVSVSSGQ